MVLLTWLRPDSHRPRLRPTSRRTSKQEYLARPQPGSSGGASSLMASRSNTVLIRSLTARLTWERTMSSRDSSSGHDEYRRPSESELHLVEALLTANFPGRDDLLTQLGRAEVRPIDSDGSLSIYVPAGPAAAVSRRVPVEAVVEDE